LYREASPETTAAIDAALLEDWTLREKLEVLKASAENLDKLIESPRMEVVLKVLDYARNGAVAESV
jgi:hypothetical protein